jgi:hypothetical protein
MAPQQPNLRTESLWIGSQKLIRVLRSGMRDLTTDKFKTVYGFEQLLSKKK